MPYEINKPLSLYLPPDTISVEPLEFEWAEATNAIIFTSGFGDRKFNAWHDALLDHYTKLVGGEFEIQSSPDKELGCLKINFSGTPWIDLNCALCKKKKNFKNLNAWIASTTLKKMVKRDRPAMAGMLRVRPE